MEMLSIHLMAAKDIEKWWSDIELCLDAQPTLWNEVFTKQGIKDCALKGQIQIWAIVKKEELNICFMTQMYKNEVQRILNVWWMMGTGLEEALPCIDGALDKYAAAYGCETVEVQGRLGLKKLLEPVGAKFLCATFARKVRKVVEN